MRQYKTESGDTVTEMTWKEYQIKKKNHDNRTFGICGSSEENSGCSEGVFQDQSDVGFGEIKEAGD
jgi:hypothetical protein